MLVIFLKLITLGKAKKEKIGKTAFWKGKLVKKQESETAEKRYKLQVQGVSRKCVHIL